MGAVFALFAGFYFWAPKIIGKNFNDFLGKIHFWTLFVGVNLTFFPQHFLGLAGMPRRIPDYPDAYTGWNFISSFGSIVSVIAIIIFSYVIYDIFVNQENSKDSPWDVPAYFTDIKMYYNDAITVSSLEWALKTPVSAHAFNVLPIQS